MSAGCTPTVVAVTLHVGKLVRIEVHRLGVGPPEGVPGTLAALPEH